MHRTKSAVLSALCFGLAAPATAQTRNVNSPGVSVEIAPLAYILDTFSGQAGADVGGEVRFHGPLALFGDVNYMKENFKNGIDVFGAPQDQSGQSLSLTAMERTQAQGGLRLYLAPTNLYFQGSVVWQGGSYQYSQGTSTITDDVQWVGPAVGVGARMTFVTNSYIRLGVDAVWPATWKQTATDGGSGAASAVSNVNGLWGTRGPIPNVTIAVGLPL